MSDSSTPSTRRLRCAAVAAIALGAATPRPAAPQQTPTPQLFQQASSRCPADARIKFDASSISGADGVRWELRRGSPGSVPVWDNAEQIDQGQLQRVNGNKPVGLRDYGATLNGTPYLARIQATQGGQAVADWSEPADYAPAYAATAAMFSATPVTTGPQPQLRLQWSLTGGLSECADRIRYEIKKDAPFSSATDEDPNTFMAEGLAGVSGERLLPIVGGPGDYHVRILARFGGDTPDKDVGLRSPAVRVTFQPPVITYAVDVLVLDGAASACASSQVGRGNATARLTGGDNTWSETTDPQGRVRFTVPAGTYTLQATHQGCSSAETSVTVSANTQRTLTLADCDATRADLAVALSGAGNPVGGRPYALSLAVRNAGTARAPATSVALRRTDASGGVRSLSTTPVPALCPGQQQGYTTEDPAPAAGQTYTYTAQVSVTDANAANNVASRRVSFSTEVVVNQPLSPGTPPPAIAAFTVREGRPYVTVNRAVPLTITATGDPTSYRAALRSSGCSTDILRASWQAWSPSTPPTWRFTRIGPSTVCLQLARGSGEPIASSSIAEDAIGVVEPRWTSGMLGNNALIPPAPAPLQVNGPDCGSKFAVGVDARAGQYVDAIALRCADLGPAGEHSNVTTTEFRGGNGGRLVSLRCQSGEVLARVVVRYGLYIDRVTIGCRAWRQDSGSNGTARTAGSAGGTSGTASATADCPQPLAVTRLPDMYIRPGLGTFVSAFRVACATPSDL